MEAECMRECMRKLALWHTRTFKPIMTHDELEPILATMGFTGLPPAAGWKEYVFSAAAAAGGSGGGWRSRPSGSAAQLPSAPPRPRLPYPRIDGLHIYTYRAFIDAVNFYLDMCDISDLFHIRGMPLHRFHDRSKTWKWRRMEEDDSVFVYREGTLDQATFSLYHLNKQASGNGGRGGGNNCNSYDSIVIRQKGNSKPVSGMVVPLKDIIV